MNRNRKRWHQGLISCLIFVFCIPPVLAKSDYIYRQRVNWVKITKASPKEVPVGNLRHPQSIRQDQMEGMLLSIKIAKRYLLKKGLKSVTVFNEAEARRFAPYLTQALAELDPDHVVNFAVVHKRPEFILRNDLISMGNLWMEEDGLHIHFDKLYAKLLGDYESSTNMRRQLNKAKSMRLMLEAQPGQKLGNSALEVILDPHHPFTTSVSHEEEKIPEKPAPKKVIKSPKKEALPPPVKEETPSPVAREKESAAERLRKLESLKEQKLISEKEYKEARKKIVKDL